MILFRSEEAPSGATKPSLLRSCERSNSHALNASQCIFELRVSSMSLSSTHQHCDSMPCLHRGQSRRCTEDAGSDDDMVRRR